MKTFSILFFTLLIVNVAIGQSCLPQGITFTTQAQIDNFYMNYPNCTQIEGNVTISGSDITNLNGLSVLTSIGGEFWIAVNEGLTTFQGLNSLTSVGGLLNINYNNSLTSIADLNSLSSVGGSFIIAYNAALSSLTGLNALTSIGGDLQIIGNYSLISLSGLDNLEANSIADLYIKENYSLSTCHVQSICNYLANPYGSVNIYNNAVGCNNPPEVANNCLINLPCLPYGNYYFYCQSDIDNFQINYPNCSQIEGDVVIVGSNITSLDGLIVIRSIGGDFKIYDTDSLINLTGLDSLLSIGKIVFMYNNLVLTSLEGMEGLTTIGDEFHLHSNNALTSLTGLPALTFIGGSLIITEEPSMTTLSGLINLTSIGGGIYIIQNEALASLSGMDNIDASSIILLDIHGNSSLSMCEVQSICDYLVNPNGSILIYDNATGCNNKYEVELACGVGMEENNISENQLNIYPNPSSDNITIETLTKGNISILNLKSQELLKKEITSPSTTIDVRGLTNGIYIVKVIGEKGIQVGKFVKQ